jgi:FkbM family methyltransferase
MLCTMLIIKMTGIQTINSIIKAIINSVDINRTLPSKHLYQSQVDLLTLAYKQIGVLNFGNTNTTGEFFALNYIAKKYITKTNCVLFDVGANGGHYSKLLREIFPEAIIYAFEPLPRNYSLLKNNLADHDVHTIHSGLGSTSTKLIMYSSSEDETGELATFYKHALLDLYKAENILEFEVDIKTLDDFCELHNIHFIDFCKIDVEGHELEVLQGAREMILGNRINIIQFEFNEINVISRVFLRDFYQILADYNLYRIKKDFLIPMFDYDSKNEIFKYQNILAIRKAIDSK